MKYIKDFFYNFFDLIIALIVISAITFVLYTNIDHLLNVEVEATDITSMNDVEESKELQEIEVSIPTNIEIDKLADILLEYNVIENKDYFIEEFKYKKDNLISGKHELRQNMTNEELNKVIFK